MSGPILRIVARRVPWPSLAERPNRENLRLRWDALTECGELLVPATTHPFYDGAHALAERGVDPETPVTMRHAGAAHDSFVPIPLRVPAASGAKRAAETEEKRRAFAERVTCPKETGETGPEGVRVAETPSARPVAEARP